MTSPPGDTVVVIDGRFNGPPDSANGGYAAGTVCRTMTGPAEVTLRRPPPLDTPLHWQVSGAGPDAEAVLLSPSGDGAPLAEARPADGAALRALVPPIMPTEKEATAAEARHVARGIRHWLSDCVVCGPERADGFRLSTGPLDGRSDVGAAVFRPNETLATPDGFYPEEVLWAALDCPGFVPEMWQRYLESGTPYLLGRLSVALERPVSCREMLIAVGWLLRRDGRKDHTAAALLTPSGELVGRSQAVWVRLRDPK